MSPTVPAGGTTAREGEGREGGAESTGRGAGDGEDTTGRGVNSAGGNGRTGGVETKSEVSFILKWQAFVQSYQLEAL